MLKPKGLTAGKKDKPKQKCDKRNNFNITRSIKNSQLQKAYIYSENSDFDMHVCIITPTYNERENIEATIKRILTVIKEHKLRADILVVDDNSPDRTWEIVEELKGQYSNVHLIKRLAKTGLGSAYLDGFKYAVQNLHADAIVQMDADMSHNPEEIPNLVSALSDADMVVGSRYVQGGRTLNWGIKRKVLSRGGNFFARTFARLRNIRDCTSGFRIFKTDLLSKMNLESINIYGYAFLLNFLCNAKRAGARIKEIPITFADRKEGKSKLGKKDIAEFFATAIRLWVKK